MLKSALAHPAALILAGVALCLIVYTVYKVSWRRDFGLPVRRRLFCHGLEVERDQVAYVPFWWSDLQVQRAVDAHWRRTMQRGVERRAGTASLR